jgi:site-specific DNA-methyltransferase (adenine-specific)
MSLNHFIDKEKLSKQEKYELKEMLTGWKTPQLKSCFEPIMFAQKPTEGTFLNNVKKHKIGLVNTGQTTESGMFPANVMITEFINPAIDKFFLVAKPTKQEKGDFNGHLTVKPLSLCEHLLKLTALNKKAVVLDPFLGSGTTALAAKNLGLNFIGIEINKKYADIARGRLKNYKAQIILQFPAKHPL